MGFVFFIISLVVVSAVCSLVDVDTTTSSASTPDYHFVPFGGDAFGA